jgi:hypothetical protein
MSLTPKGYKTGPLGSYIRPAGPPPPPGVMNFVAYTLRRAENYLAAGTGAPTSTDRFRIDRRGELPGPDRRAVADLMYRAQRGDQNAVITLSRILPPIR